MINQTLFTYCSYFMPDNVNETFKEFENNKVEDTFPFDAVKNNKVVDLDSSQCLV